jgi:hypothetical protein
MGNKKIKQQFYITALGSNCMILGIPWFREFNPQDIDWKNGILKGLKVKLETLLFGCFANLKDRIRLQKQQAKEDIIMELDQIYCKPAPGVSSYESESSRLESHLCRTHNSVEMAHKFRETTGQMEITLLEEFKEYKLVFSDKEAKKLPPRQDCNHKIKLTEEAPKTFNFKPYLLNPAELEFENQFLQENLEKGFIQPLESQYRFPTFQVPKKDSKEYRFIIDY